MEEVKVIIVKKIADNDEFVEINFASWFTAFRNEAQPGDQGEVYKTCDKHQGFVLVKLSQGQLVPFHKNELQFV